MKICGYSEIVQCVGYIERALSTEVRDRNLIEDLSVDTFIPTHSIWQMVDTILSTSFAQLIDGYLEDSGTFWASIMTSKSPDDVLVKHRTNMRTTSIQDLWTTWRIRWSKAGIYTAPLVREAYR